MKLSLAFVVAAATALLGTTGAHAGRPLQTDDAGILDRAACELEGAALRRTAPNERDGEDSLALTCGIGWGHQIGFALASERALDRRHAGAVVGGKGMLWSSSDSAANMSLGWQVAEARVTSGAWHHVGTGLNLIASVPLSVSDTLHANIGYARDETAHADSSTWGLGIEHALSGVRWAPMAEVFGDDRGRPWVNAGVRWESLAAKLFISGSWGRQLDPAATKLATVSFRLVL